jgi:hypothetical protein
VRTAGRGPRRGGQTTGTVSEFGAKMSWLAPSGVIGWRNKRHRLGRAGICLPTAVCGPSERNHGKYSNKGRGLILTSIQPEARNLVDSAVLDFCFSGMSSEIRSHNVLHYSVDPHSFEIVSDPKANGMPSSVWNAKLRIINPAYAFTLKQSDSANLTEEARAYRDDPLVIADVTKLHETDKYLKYKIYERSKILYYLHCRYEFFCFPVGELITKGRLNVKCAEIVEDGNVLIQFTMPAPSMEEIFSIQPGVVNTTSPSTPGSLWVGRMEVCPAQGWGIRKLSVIVGGGNEGFSIENRAENPNALFPDVVTMRTPHTLRIVEFKNLNETRSLPEQFLLSHYGFPEPRTQQDRVRDRHGLVLRLFCGGLAAMLFAACLRHLGRRFLARAIS